MPDIKLGSLFDGIGVFPLAASRCGIRPVWASEIEKAPISITKRHFPDMVHLGDITKVDGGKIPPVHIITFGSPCQNLSLIGNRSGLAGAKSSLFYQAFRIIQEMRDATDNLYPAIAVWENVMGAFSTNDRMDFRAVLSAFSDTEVPMPPSGRWGNAGMVRGGTPDVCWRLMDAQYWAGTRRLARRQRIFVVADFGGRRAADILFKPRPMLPLPPPCGEGGRAAAEGDRTASFETGRQIPVIHPFQCFRMRGAAKRQEETAFRNSFGLPTDPFPTLLSLYGEKKWGVSMYDGQTALIANYINPIIGDMEVQAVTPRAVDGYIQTLQKTKSVSTKTRKAVTTYVSDKTIEKIIKLLRCAFKQAVRWEIIARNPFDNVILPKTEYAKRDIWTADMIRLALDKCTDSKLYVAMNLSFACSLRMGEILGLTWENVHISDEDIAADNAYVYIDKELTRASKRAIETLGEKDIYYIFTPLMPNTSTRIILKKPKTDSSIRKVWLPKTLAYILREWKKSQDELKGFLGDEYQDFDLVVALPNGRPCEDRIILKEFAKLREDAGLPKVVFHSLRHSSTTYKLKLNHGDLKATQGDTGHAEIDMITSIYAHILDEDRKVNAQKFETAFYAKPDLRNVRPPEEPVKSEPATLDLESLVEQLQKSPELASALAALIAAQAPAK